MQQIQISTDLINAVRDALTQHDAEAEHPLMYIQYLAALTGIAVADMDIPETEQKQLLTDIGKFSEHVLQQQSSERHAMAARDAYGVWTPGDD